MRNPCWFVIQWYKSLHSQADISIILQTAVWRTVISYGLVPKQREGTFLRTKPTFKSLSPRASASFSPAQNLKSARMPHWLANYFPLGFFLHC